MQINIHLPTLRAALAITGAGSSKSRAKFARHVYLEPGGALSATDGYTLVHNEHAHGGFEGDPLYLDGSLKTGTARLGTALLDLDARTLTVGTGVQHAPLLTVDEVGQFPDVRGVLPDHALPFRGSAFAMNGAYLGKMVAALKTNLLTVQQVARGNGRPMLQVAGLGDLQILFSNVNIGKAVLPFPVEDVDEDVVAA